MSTKFPGLRGPVEASAEKESLDAPLTDSAQASLSGTGIAPGTDLERGLKHDSVLADGGQQEGGELRPKAGGVADDLGAPPALPGPVLRGLQATVLCPDEARELAICEGLIQEGLATAVGVALAVNTIREKRLYRAEYETFEVYAEGKWGLSVRQLQRQCFLANFTKSLTGNATPGSPFVVPSSVKQVQAMNRLPSEAERIAAWQEACRVAAARPGGQPTSKEVERIVDARLGVVRVPAMANGRAHAAKRPAVDVQPVGNREQRAQDALRRAVAAARDLVDTLGTADSVVTARAALTLEQLQAIGDHLSRVEHLQAARNGV